MLVLTLLAVVSTLLCSQPAFAAAPPNSKTRAPTVVGANDTQNQFLPGWTPWNTQNMTNSHFSTQPMGAGAWSTWLELSAFNFNIPKDSEIVGLVLSMQQCSLDTEVDWEVTGWLMRGHKMLGSLGMTAAFTPEQHGTTCFSEERPVVLGGPTEHWGLSQAALDDDAQFNSPEFGVRLQVQTFYPRSRRQRDGGSNDTTTTPAPAATTPAPTTAPSTAPSTAPTTSAPPTSTTAPATRPPTLPAVTPAPIYFHGPKLTIYYVAPCGLSGINGFVCSDDGESVLLAPTVVHADLRMPKDNSLVLRMDSLRQPLSQLVNGRPQAVLSVTGKLQLAGNLTLQFDKTPENDKTETWVLLQSETAIEGSFERVLVNITDLNMLEQFAEKMCEEVLIKMTHYGNIVNMTTRRHNKCLDAAKSHPGVVAAIVLSTLGVFLTAIVLLVLWRKRRFERSRASALSSPLAEEAELQEMRMADTKSYSEAAKMIESSGGRFEIGDDDIDDGHPEL